jgi:hypothetical protein
MQLPNLGILNEYIPVPEIFHSYTSGKPFKRCISCEKNLLENGTQYIIEKAIRQYPGFGASDVIYEYAMCLGCTEVMRNALSMDSLKVIEDYLGSRVNLVERRKRLLAQSGKNIQAWLSHCLISGTPMKDSVEYQIYAHCDGGDLLFTYLPYMISSDAVQDLDSLISSETKDVLGDFIDNHFGLPPQYKELLKRRKTLVF